MDNSNIQLKNNSADRIIQKAKSYIENIKKKQKLPQSSLKCRQVQNIAENHHQDIKYMIEEIRNKNRLFKQLEYRDDIKRKQYKSKIIKSIQKFQLNKKNIQSQKKQKYKKYMEHLQFVYTKHNEQQNKTNQINTEKALDDRKNIQQFYQTQNNKKKLAQFKQVAAKTTYQQGRDKINKIHKLNQDFSKKTQEFLQFHMNRNNHKNQILSQRKITTNNKNAKKQIVMQNFEKILQISQEKHIQKYGQNEELSLCSHKKKEMSNQGKKKKIKEFFINRFDKWRAEKSRIDIRNAQTQQNCLQRLNRSEKAIFTPQSTAISFRRNSIFWEERVKSNKQTIRENDELKRSFILSEQNDISLKNSANLRVSERMNSMKMRAKQLAACEV